MASKLLPKFVRTALKEREIKKQIFSYYDSLPPASLNAEEREALAYLKRNRLRTFLHPFQKAYNRKDIKVLEDSRLGLNYILFENKRMYFRRGWKAKDIQRDYHYLRIEQDVNSPHRYLTDSFNVRENDILVDVGAAEGNLPLAVIEKVKKVYLFETDENWIEALKATFEPWKNKVEIINKFVSDKNDQHFVSLDEFFKEKETFTFLKVDAEGEEAAILKGAARCLANPNLKLALCCYHRPNDDRTFKDFLEKRGYSVSFAKGYMIFRDMNFEAPYLRRGVLRAIAKG